VRWARRGLALGLTRALCSAALGLYFDAAGGQCVVECELSLDDPDDEETPPGEPPQEACVDHEEGGVRLIATSFEEYLAQSFFENTASDFTCRRHGEPEAEVPAMLKEFMINTFSKGNST
jgi:hypothetical protein